MINDLEGGHFDETCCRMEPIDNPFNPNLYTMSPV
jgi:hypothetical protein